jgi:membrane protease YdiL (CAAX protease family)
VSWAWWLTLVATDRTVGVGGRPTHVPGLFGPAIAALIVTGLTRAPDPLRQLSRRVLRWRIGWWWLVALSPLFVLGLSIAVQEVSGQAIPTLASLGEINGFPSWGLPGVLVLLLVAALGEETGWRGFLQPTLQRHLRPLFAMIVVAIAWAGWHAPLFAIVAGYRGFTVVTLIGFSIGLLCGAIVLGWLYNRTGSVLAVAVWHATYNVTSATTGAHGLPAALSTTVVIAAATVLVVADAVMHGRVLATAAA